MAGTSRVLRHVKIETAIARRKCHHSSKHRIEKGENHLAIYEGEPKKRKNYCYACARKIIDLAMADLQQLDAALGPVLHNKSIGRN